MTVSPFLDRPLRSEVEVRRERLESDLRDEGASDETVARLATAQNASKMLAYEARTMDFIAGLCGVGR